MTTNGKTSYPQGQIKRLWAESYDRETGQFLLMPADDLSYVFCPMNSQSFTPQSPEKSFRKRTLTRIRRSLWRLALKSIETAHIGGDGKASQVVDHCLGLQDLLAESNGG